LYLLFEELIHEYRITSKYRNILFRAGGYGRRLYSGDETASIVNMPLAISAIKKAAVYKLPNSRDESLAANLQLATFRRQLSCSGTRRRELQSPNVKAIQIDCSI
jgi:hypothetical protein